MEMILGSARRENVDLFCVRERGDVAPKFLRFADQVPPFFRAEDAMQEVMRVGMRHEVEGKEIVPQNAVTSRTF